MSDKRFPLTLRVLAYKLFTGLSSQIFWIDFRGWFIFIPRMTSCISLAIL